MKKFVRNAFTIGLLHAAVLLSAQTNWPWAVKSSGSAIEESQGIASDALDNSYVIGTYQSGSATIGSTNLAPIGSADVFLEKLDDSGNVLWAVRAGGTLGERGIKVVANLSGTDVFITGMHRGNMTFYSTNATIYNLTAPSTSDNCFIARYNSSGVIQWAATYGGTGNDMPHDMAISNSSQRIYVTGHTDPPTFSDSKLFTVCLDFAGVQKWDIVSTGTGITQGWGIAADAAGNSYSLVNYENISSVTLPSGTYTGTDGMLLIKTTINGAISWVKNFGSGSGGTEKGRGVKLDNANNIYFAGYYGGTASISPFSLSNAGSGTTDLFAAKCDNAGTVLWTKSIGGTNNEILKSLAVTSDGTSHLLAINEESNTVNVGCQIYTAMPSTTDNKFFVAKIKTEGYISGSGSARVGNSSSQPDAICTDNLGYTKITGSQQGSITFGSITLGAVTRDVFVAKLVIWDETPQVTSPVNTCVGQSASLSAYVLSGSPAFNWYNSSNVLVGTGSSYVTPVFTSPSSTNFSVSASYPGGCVTPKVPITVNAIANTTLLASADQTICAGNCASLTFAFSGGPGGMATIQPGDTLISSPHTVCPLVTTKYTLTNGLFSQCQIGDQVKITVVSPPLFAGDYKAYVYPSTPCSNTDDEKATCPTVGCISTTTPSSTHLPTFRCQISEQAGWQGAGNVGITGFNISGQYTVDVYEADINGNRKVTGGITAPSVFLQYGVSPAATLVLPFNSSGNGAGFTPTTTTNPFTSDGTADGTGVIGTGDYFKDRYTAAYNNTVMGLAGEKLADYSNVIFCVDMKQVPFPGYCSVSKKSYFKIANNGLLNGRGARLANQEDANETLATVTGWDIYPNPSSGLFHIKFELTSGADQAQVFDYTGKLLNVHKLSGTNHILDLSAYAKGIYFIRLNGSHASEMKKIVLE